METEELRNLELNLPTVGSLIERKNLIEADKLESSRRDHQLVIGAIGAEEFLQNPSLESIILSTGLQNIAQIVGMEMVSEAIGQPKFKKILEIEKAIENFGIETVLRRGGLEQRGGSFDPSQPPLRKGRRQQVLPLEKGELEGVKIYADVD